jgi:hypothetical protein
LRHDATPAEDEVYYYELIYNESPLNPPQMVHQARLVSAGSRRSLLASNKKRQLQRACLWNSVVGAFTVLERSGLWRLFILDALVCRGYFCTERYLGG